MATQFHLVGRIAVDVETPTGGGEGALGVDYLITRNIFARAAFRYETIGITFKGDGMLSNARDGDPTSVDVPGANDPSNPYPAVPTQYTIASTYGGWDKANAYFADPTGAITKIISGLHIGS